MQVHIRKLFVCEQKCCLATCIRHDLTDPINASMLQDYYKQIDEPSTGAGDCECKKCPESSSVPNGMWSSSSSDCKCRLGYYDPSGSSSSSSSAYPDSDGGGNSYNNGGGSSYSNGGGYSNSDGGGNSGGGEGEGGGSSYDNGGEGPGRRSGSDMLVIAPASERHVRRLLISSNQTCSACPAGKYAMSPGSCYDCWMGSYQGESAATSCRGCEAGKYSASSAASSCTSCGDASSHRTSPPSASSKSQCVCEVGYFESARINGLPNCTACPAGKYGSWPGDPCYECWQGSYSEAAASTGCTFCETGKYGDAAVPRNSSLSCVACPHHSSTDWSGAYSIDDCKCQEGYFRDLSTSSGSSSGGSLSCLACPVSADPVYQPYEWSCRCKESHYRNSSDSSNIDCDSCPPNAKSESWDQSRCLCVKGYTGADTGYNLGPSPSNGGCIACAAGKYKDSSGSWDCYDCPVDHSSETGATTYAACYWNGELELKPNTKFGDHGDDSVSKLAGELMLAADITACRPLSQNFNGKIAVIRSGGNGPDGMEGTGCDGTMNGGGMATKVLHAQNAGAVAVIIFSKDSVFKDWQDKHGTAEEASSVTIPSALISFEVGERIVSMLESGSTVTSSLLDTGTGAGMLARMKIEYTGGAPRVYSDLQGSDDGCVSEVEFNAQYGSNGPSFVMLTQVSKDFATTAEEQTCVTKQDFYENIATQAPPSMRNLGETPAKAATEELRSANGAGGGGVAGRGGGGGGGGGGENRQKSLSGLEGGASRMHVISTMLRDVMRRSKPVKRPASATQETASHSERLGRRLLSQDASLHLSDHEAAICGLENGVQLANNSAKYGACVASEYRSLEVVGMPSTDSPAYAGEAFSVEVYKRDIYNQTMLSDSASGLTAFTSLDGARKSDQSINLLGQVFAEMNEGKSVFSFAVTPSFSNHSLSDGTTTLFRQPLLYFQGADAIGGLSMESSISPVAFFSGSHVCRPGEILLLQAEGATGRSGSCSMCRAGTYSISPLAYPPSSQDADPSCLQCPTGGLFSPPSPSPFLSLSL